MISVNLMSLVFFLLVSHFLKLQWKTRGFPPGPTPFPIIGSMWWINFRADHGSLKKLAKTYGNVCTLWLGSRPIVVLYGYQAVKDGLTTNSEDVSGQLQTHIFNKMANGKEKVQKELDAVLSPSHLICYEDRKRLPYTYAVIHEIMRFGSIVLITIPTEAVKDTNLFGYQLPKGTMIMANIDSALFDPEYWETPHQFNPGHFLDKDGNFVIPEAFLAFSAGHRMCLEEVLAKMEFFIIFCNLLQAFKLTAPEGVKELNTDMIFGSTMKPHPYKLCAVLR